MKWEENAKNSVIKEEKLNESKEVMILGFSLHEEVLFFLKGIPIRLLWKRAIIQKVQVLALRFIQEIIFNTGETL